MRSLVLLLLVSIPFFAAAESQSAFQCEGNLDGQLVRVGSYSLGENSPSTGYLRLGDRHIRFDGMQVQFFFHVQSATVIKWTTAHHEQELSLERIAPDKYRVTWQVPNVPTGSLRVQVQRGELITDRCNVAGPWVSRLNTTLPADFKNFSSSDLVSSIRHVHSSDYAEDDKIAFYRETLNNADLSFVTKGELLRSIFSEKSSPELQLTAFDKIGAQDSSLTSIVADAIANCEYCDLNEKVWLSLYSTVHTQLRAHAEHSFEAWKSFANLIFRNKSKPFSHQSQALDMIFSRQILVLSDEPDLQLANLAELLTATIPSGDLSAQDEALFDRLISSPLFTKRTAQKLVSGLFHNHSYEEKGQPTLPTSLQLKILQKLVLKRWTDDERVLQQIHWLIAEGKARTIAPTEIDAWVSAHPSDYAVVENALARIADLEEPLPQIKHLLFQIWSNLSLVNPNFLDYTIDDNEHGVAHDLAMFSFSRQAKVSDVGFNTLAPMLIYFKPLSTQLLEKIGTAIYGSPFFPEAESRELLSLVTQHTNYVEGASRLFPNEGMITLYLSRSIKNEQKAFENKASSRFGVSFLASLLKRIVETGHLDRSDPDNEKRARYLLRESSTL
jgi:hypothetical protein